MILHPSRVERQEFAFSEVDRVATWVFTVYVGSDLGTGSSGFGWNLLGTADYKVNIGIIHAKTVWFLSVGAIVIGHIVSVYIAHVILLRRVPNHSLALRGQYPMLLLMVLYTATSLWIIAQPIVEG